MQRGSNIRPTPFALFAKALNDFVHFVTTAIGVDHLVTHAHGDFLAGVSGEKTLDKQVAHQDADEDATIGAVLLLGRVFEVEEAQRAATQNVRDFFGSEPGFVKIGAAEGVVVKSNTINGGYQQEGPVGATLGEADVAVVVDGQEDVSDAREVREGGANLTHVWLFHEEKGHGRAEEDDASLGVFGEDFALEVPA